MTSDLLPKFTQYAHIARAITVDYPAHWGVEVNPDHPLCVEFKSPEIEAVAALFIALPYTIDPAAFTSEQHLHVVLRAILDHAGIVSGGDPSKLLQYPSCNARLKDGTNSWATFHGDLLIVIQVRYPESHEHIYEPLFDRMLTSFRIHRDQQVAQQRLRSAVIDQLATRLPGVPCEVQGDRIKLASIEISLSNLEAMIAQSPEVRDDLIKNYVDSVVQVVQRQSKIGEETWDEIQTQLFPMIRHDRIVYALEDQPGKAGSEQSPERLRPVASAWLADLVICYAIDSADSLRIVSHFDLERWGIDAAQLHDRAMQNLAQSELPSVVAVPLADGKIALGGLGEGGISSKSSYVLHPQLYDRVTAAFGSAVWVAIPSRDSLMIFSQQCSDRSTLLNAVRQDFKQSHHALSDRLFEVTPDGVVLA